MSIASYIQHTIEFNEQNSAYILDIDKSPVIYANHGDHILVETMNAFSKETDTGEELNQVINKGYHHPFTGPIYINHVQPGMTVAVKIENIELSAFGYTCISRSSGVLKGLFQGRNYKKLFLQTGMIDFENMNLQTIPSLGGIGLADPSGTRNGATCPHGGNLDFRQMVAGSVVYLPAAVEGGLLYMGDLHARQGDGELSGIALEASGRVHVSLSMLSRSIPCPIIHSSDHILIAGYGDTFEDAAKMAVSMAVSIVAHAKQLQDVDAYILLGFSAHLIIGHFTGRIKSAAVQIPHEVLKIEDIFGVETVL
ncbi:acetamidase/formamidase family protein [Paenibacillus sp. SC116]|uniref:acetamidase/formamidase family protein n=1 Tax=Paenibacillus sp. SC116 TaxID=2968986 RepID=UPI00215A5EA2|nr:acetamidase/formamidase family protein [Paenibacillus sp. SC116]MCR8843872.1 acetamidase/formamidase family protein [Paenibacillus sp. SC116]